MSNLSKSGPNNLETMSESTSEISIMVKLGPRNPIFGLSDQVITIIVKSQKMGFGPPRIVDMKMSVVENNIKSG